MKKKIVFKIVFLSIAFLFFLYFIISAFYYLPMRIESIKIFKKYISNPDFVMVKDTYQNAINQNIRSIIFSFLNCIPPLLLLIVLLYKDCEIINVSIIKTVKEYRIKTAEQRETKRQTKIQRKIAQKQAEIERLNNSAKNE